MALQLLLAYLPPDQRQWEATLSQKRAEYARFCKVKIQHCIRRLLLWPPGVLLRYHLVVCLNPVPVPQDLIISPNGIGSLDSGGSAAEEVLHRQTTLGVRVALATFCCMQQDES
jgi:hypothetical protein